MRELRVRIGDRPGFDPEARGCDGFSRFGDLAADVVHVRGG